MSTFLHLLRIAFWMQPFQRWCTALGLGLLAVLGGLLFSPSNLAVNLMMYGMLIAFAPPALLAGALWRALSAPRAARLAPRGRARLLLAALGVAATVALLVIALSALFDLSLPPRWRTNLSGYRSMFVGAFAAASWWGIASFIASRSPLAMLGVLLASLGGVSVLWKLDVEHVATLWRHGWGIALPLALWALFGAWYLQTRRIAPPGWLLPGGQSVLASVTTADTAAAGFTPSAAQQRLLLGGTTVPRILMQWLLAGLLWLGVLMVLAQDGEQAAVSAAHIAFASLLLCPAIVMAQSLAIVRRARVLWLPSGYSRARLFTFTERTVLAFAAAMALMFSGFLIALWYTQPWRPAVTLPQALCVVLAPSLLVASNALVRSRTSDFYWRWPVLAFLGWHVAWQPLALSGPVSWAGTRGWLWIGVTLLVAVLLRMLARMRWLGADMPRMAAS
jgi:hypothetical protein